MNDTRTRSILKAISWRAGATCATITLVFGFTGQFKMAAVVGGLEVVVKMFLYFLHERVWGRVSFGKRIPTPYVIWLTGLSGSGKTTIGNLLAKRLHSRGIRAERLDGDVTRAILPQTGFSKQERDAHVLKAGFIAQMLERNGVFVIASYISPYADARAQVRAMCHNFIEVHLDTPLEVCEQRDVKGLYEKARRGEIDHFTGIDDPYEPPRDPDLKLDTTNLDVDQACDRIEALFT